MPPSADRAGPAARERLLDAAAEAFAADGFDATPTARVAAAAGTPKGLLFYYFPRKADLLVALFQERLPTAPLCTLDGVVEAGDVAGSLARLAARLDLGRHESLVLRVILLREVDTHPEAREHMHRLTDGLTELTERVLDGASPRALDPAARHEAALAYVSVMLFAANAQRYDGPAPDLAAVARLVAAGLAS